MAAATYRVVVHLMEGEPARQEAAPRYITNLLPDLGPEQTEEVTIIHHRDHPHASKAVRD